MGAATIAKFHSNAEFLADIKAARKEVKAKGISACFWMRSRTTASRAATGCLSSCQAFSSSPILTRSPLTQRRRPLVHAIGACHSVGSDVAQAWASHNNRSAEQCFQLMSGGPAFSGSETYQIGGDIDDSTYLLRIALCVTVLIRPVRLGGGPKPKRNSRTHQHRCDVRT